MLRSRATKGTDATSKSTSARSAASPSSGIGFMQTSAPGRVDEGTALSPGYELGNWRIIDLIGRGGMGEVYKAERHDGQFDQIVALKVMKIGDQRMREAFHLERQRLAQLDHPGVTRIIDGGTIAEDGRPFMVMEYVDGANLQAVIEEQDLPLADRLTCSRNSAGLSAMHTDSSSCIAT